MEGEEDPMTPNEGSFACLRSIKDQVQADRSKQP